MKKILLAAASIILLMASCTQQNTPSPNNNSNSGGNTSMYIIDSTYFFKINFQNKTLFNFAVKTTVGIPYTYSMSSLVMTNGNNGMGLMTALYITTGDYNILIPKQSTCAVAMILTRYGIETGLYKDAPSNQIEDLTNGKMYKLDTASIVFNVTNVGMHNVTGNFTCKLVDYPVMSTSIPASGSFNLYK
jgi:hypothetical protein